MSVWPDFAEIQGANYALGAPNDVERTEWDDGAARQARIFTQARLTRQVEARIETGRLGDFRSWAREWAHRDFAFIDPHDGQTRQVRVLGGFGGMEFRQVATSEGPLEWEVKLTLEGDE